MPEAVGLVQEERGDLTSRTDVHDLVVAFYREVALDELLEPVFSEVAEVDWAVHIPKLVDYWCGVLLDLPGVGAIVAAHRHVHEARAVTPELCDRWFELWVDCVDDRWSGPTAERAKRHAEAMMTGMARAVFGVEWGPPAD